MSKMKKNKMMPNKRHRYIPIPCDRISRIDREQKKASAELERIIREIYEEGKKE